jgi:hypothetical protein
VESATRQNLLPSFLGILFLFLNLPNQQNNIENPDQDVVPFTQAAEKLSIFYSKAFIATKCRAKLSP